MNSKTNKNQQQMTSVNTCSGGGYVTPEVYVFSIQSEGVLCSSGNTETFKEQDCTTGFWDE